MTKERKLAIEMWQTIRDTIAYRHQQVAPADIKEYKDRFCKDHGLNWAHNCWFCQYIVACFMCPLSHCAWGSDYYRALHGSTHEVRVEACNNIIKALGGEV